MASYLRPKDLETALAAMAEAPRTVLAGGTDFFPARVGKPLDDDVLDVTGIESLGKIEDLGDRYRIGASVSWTQVIEEPLPPMFDGLKRAAREVGGVQVQNAGTIVGNVCNASPAADGVPNLLALDAVIELASRDNARSVPIAAFITGNREIVRARDEVVTGITIPKPVEGTTSSFLKLGARQYLVISIVMTAGILEPAADGTVSSIRLAVGSCSAVARRLRALEGELRGRPIDAGLQEAVTEDHLAVLTPIDDVRGSGEYRMDAALTLVRRTLAELGSA